MIDPLNVDAILADLAQRGGVGIVAFDGDYFIEHLPDGWQVLELGDPPHVVLAACDGATFELTLYVEGDLSVEGFTTREERDARAEELARLYG